MLYSHHHDQLCKYTCRNMSNTIKTSDTVLRKIYLSLYLKGLCVRGSWRPNRTATYWPPLLWPSVFPFHYPGLLNWGPGAQPLWVLVFSTASYLQLVWSPNSLNFLCTELYNSSTPTQYLPITGHQNMELPLFLEWHVWSSLSGNNCHAVHGSLSSGASVCDCTVGF